MADATRLKIIASVEGVQGFDNLKRSLQGLAQQGSTTQKDLFRLVDAYKQLKSYGDNTITGMRAQVAALTSLRESVGINSRAYKEWGAEIDRVNGKLKSLQQVEKPAPVRAPGAGIAAVGGLLATAGLTRLAAAPVRTAATFDAEVRRASAIEGSVDAYDKLRQRIEQVAATAAGTPTEVAVLATSLSRAGFTARETTESLDGIVKGAEATSVSFAEMGSIAADNLRSFGIATSDTGRVVDVLVNTANKSNQTILDLGESMKYAAPVARSLGISMEGTAATLGLLANSGIRGSEAGTALRTGLVRLQIAASGSNEELEGLTRGNELLARTMRILGADITTANGALRPMDQVILKLKSNLEKLSVGRRAEIVKALFGDEQGSKFLALINNSEASIIQMFTAIGNSSGVAADTQQKMKGFAYEMQVLGGNVEIVSNAIGDKFNAALMPMAKLLNLAIGEAQKMPKPLQDIAAVAAGIGLTAAAVTGLAGSIALANGAFAALGTTLAIPSLAVLFTVGGWAIAAAGATALVVGIGKASGAMDGLEASSGRAYRAMNDLWRGVTTQARDSSTALGSARDQIDKLAPGLKPLAEGIRGLAKAFAEMSVSLIANLIPGLREAQALGRLMGLGKTDQERLTAAGSTATYTVGGITYDTATGRPKNAPALAPIAPASPVPIPVTGAPRPGPEPKKPEGAVIRGGAVTSRTRDPDAEATGWDIVMPGGRGAPVQAPLDLTITGTGFQGSGAGSTGRGYGNWISGEFALGGKTYELLLGHFDRVDVAPGMKVPAGATIGSQGITGRTFGTHVTTHVNPKAGATTGDAWNALEAVTRVWEKGAAGGQRSAAAFEDEIKKAQKAAEQRRKEAAETAAQVRQERADTIDILQARNLQSAVDNARTEEERIRAEYAKDYFATYRELTKEVEGLIDPESARARIASVDAEMYQKQQRMLSDIAALETQRSSENWQQSQVNLQATLTDYYQQQADILSTQNELASNIAQTLGQGLSQALNLAIQGTDDWNRSLSEIASSTLRSIADQLIQIAVISPVINGLRGLLSGPAAGIAPIAPGISALPGGDFAGAFAGGGGMSFTGALPAATLSPGAFQFATGGIMTPQGPVPLRSYARGGVAMAPQAAIFGEGSTPEAFVPLPDGRRIPVALRQYPGIPGGPGAAPGFEQTDAVVQRLVESARQESAVRAATTAAAGPDGTMRIQIETTRINSVDYITAAQAEALAQAAATRSTARQQRALQASPAARRSVGI